MALPRKFIDWREPILPAAAEYLLDRYGTKSTLDCGNVLTVVPGSRAGRVLLESLVRRADERQLIFTPPQIVTVGELPEQLYQSKRPHAGDLVQRLAWTNALKDAKPDRLSQFIARTPDDDDAGGWLELGDLLGRLHRELAADDLNFKDVADGFAHGVGFDESERWRFLAQVQRKYLDILDDLHVWDRQTARLVAIDQQECRTDNDIVLVATVDMNRSLRKMIEQVADHVTALVYAPQELAERFDAFGYLLPAAWRDGAIDVDDSIVKVVRQPAEQSEAVAEALAALDGKYSAKQVTIGVPDERFVPQLQRRLTLAGVRTRYGVGRLVSETLPYRLIETAVDYAATRRFPAFAALVRHADVHDWLAGEGIQENLLTELDAYFGEHLPARLGKSSRGEKDFATVEQVRQLLDNALAPLRAKPCSLSDWSSRIAQVLNAFYGEVELDRGLPAQRETLDALEAIRAALIEFQSIPRSVEANYSAADAAGMMLQQIGREHIAPPPDAEAIELRGWLELPTDPAPVLIVTSLNEGFVPSSLNADLFLPNALRRSLEILDNDRRFARDAYALSVLLASREHVTLIAGRRDVDGQPLVPSRLLFATDPLTAARRAKRFFDPDLTESTPPPAVTRRTEFLERSAFVVPRPMPLDEPIDYMSVTSFRAYVECPYRFYLSRVLKLEAVEDSADELDPRAFGGLIHDVLQAFGKSAVRESTVAADVAEFLLDQLGRVAFARYGRDPLPAVLVQLEHARARLQAFARWQTDWRNAGWRIEQTEEERGADRFDLKLDDGRTMHVGGRIDRIDRHERDGTWAILDYKTSENGKGPQETHRDKDEWVDLQLPLYRHIAREKGVTGDVRLGYIVLPKDVEQVGAKLADWTEQELAEADARAKEIARCVLDQQFWPPVEDPPYRPTDFAAICQEDVFGRRLEGEEAAP